MSIVGFQDYWIVGTRFYFQPDPVAAVEQPLIDFGTIQQCTPNVALTKIELKDPDGGLKRLVDEATTDITESYDLTCSNFNNDTLAVLLLANAAEAFTQTVVEKTVAHWVTPGRLFKVIDSDVAKTYMYNLGTIAGLYTGTVTTVALSATGNSIDATAKSIKVVGDMTAVTQLANGKAFFVNRAGLANIANSRTYTVVNKVFSNPDTTITVAETPAATETVTGGSITRENAGTIYKQDVDWKVGSLTRGFVQAIPGGAIAAAASLTLVYTTAALSGSRLLKPQSKLGEIRGKFALVLGRGNKANEHVREGRCSLSGSSATFSADDFSSMVLQAKVLNDFAATDIAGRLLYYVGAVPTSS